MSKSRKYTDEQVIAAVRANYSMAGVLRAIGLVPLGGSYKTVNAIIKRLQINTSHFTGQGHLRGKNHNWSKSIPIDQMLVINSNHSSHSFKLRLFKAGLLINKCSICGITEWLNRSLSLHMDHINGINDDNRLVNLRILCPNCHSQTATYCAKNMNRNKEVPSPGIEPGRLSARAFKTPSATVTTRGQCKNCRIETKNSRCGYCIKCKNKFIKQEAKYKIKWPTKEELHKLIWEKPTSTLAKELGVSDKAVEKHCKKLGLLKPPRGYWAKQPSPSIPLLLLLGRHRHP